MSSFVYMKILESSPERYDRGIHWLTLGKLGLIYDRLTQGLSKDQTVLDIGCGTGALTLRAAAKGAKVTAIDINPEMLEIAKTKAKNSKPAGNIVFKEMGIAELEEIPDQQFNVVVSGLCFSELSPEELDYTLGQIYRLLKNKGLLIVADEARAKSVLKRALNALLRWPLACLTFLLTQTTTHSVINLAEKITQAGFVIQREQYSKLDSFLEITAQKI